MATWWRTAYVNKRDGAWTVEREREEWRWCSDGVFPRGYKILVFIRLVPVLVTFDKNACYAFQTRPGPEPVRKAVQGIVREQITRILSLPPFPPVYKRVAANLYPYKYLYAMISRIQWQIFPFSFFSFPPVLIHYSLDFHQDFFFFATSSVN